MKYAIQFLIFSLIIASPCMYAKNGILQEIPQNQNVQLSQSRTITLEFQRNGTLHRFPFIILNQAPSNVVRAAIRGIMNLHVQLQRCNGECCSESTND